LFWRIELSNSENEETNKELIERIKKMERKLDKFEKSSRIGLEDQLFFGFIISLVVFLLSLPLTEVVSFFQNVTRFSLDLATNTAQTTRYSGLGCLFLASVMRYYGAMSKLRVSKRYRLWSLRFLVMGWDFFLFFFVTSACVNASLIFGGMEIPIASLVLTGVYVAILFLEKKALRFYASRELIFKKDTQETVSWAFLALTFSFYIAFVVEFVVTIRGMPFSSERFIAVWLGCTFLFSSFSSIKKFARTLLKK
jgi:hypothetical protein